MADASELVHATAICIAGRAALIRGPSGAGKSDLALRCLSLGPSLIAPTLARLVADDQTLLVRRGATLIAKPPESIAGRFEIRGLGVVNMDYEREAVVALIVDLGTGEPSPRFPDPWPKVVVLGLAAPVLRLSPFEASAAARVLAALTVAELPDLCDAG